jgi:uncharacterized protein YecE (DUF72 family)
MKNILIGTSGFSYDHWKDILYPRGLSQKKWLAYYAQRYDTVEINATFYRFFARTVFARWRDETPDDFRFTLKGPRDITHVKRLHEIEPELARFLDSIQDIQPKLALLLWQFPPSFKYGLDDSTEKLARFLQRLPGHIRHAVEFRHRSWFNDELYALLNAHGVAFVVNDSSRFHAAETITGDVGYIRFHGPTKLYASPYSSEALQQWAEKIDGWLEQYDVYVYFNNDFGGHAIRNSVELRERLAAHTLPRSSSTTAAETHPADQ